MTKPKDPLDIEIAQLEKEIAQLQKEIAALDVITSGGPKKKKVKTNEKE